MYPANFFSLFPPFPRDKKVFVILGASAEFEARWTNVIEPAIRCVQVGNTPLIPHRAGQIASGDSSLQHVLHAVANSKLVFADLTAIGSIADKPIWDEKVMYELGLAHAVRHPAETVLYRSDSHPLPFEVESVHVNVYSPDRDADGARFAVAQALIKALEAVDQTKITAVARAADSLDARSLHFLLMAQQRPLVPPRRRSTSDLINSTSFQFAIIRLLELGLLKATYTQVPRDQLYRTREPIESIARYEVTPFGDAVAHYAVQTIGHALPP